MTTTDYVLRPRADHAPESEARILRDFLFIDVLPGLAAALCERDGGDVARRAELDASASMWRAYLRANAAEHEQYADLAPIVDASADVIDEAIRAAEARHGWSRPAMRAVLGRHVG